MAPYGSHIMAWNVFTIFPTAAETSVFSKVYIKDGGDCILSNKLQAY